MQVGNKGVVTGTQIAYASICKRKLWLYTYGVKMEEFSERVEEAKVLHLTSYPNKTKEVEIPGCGIKVDFCEKDGSIHEVKMSKSVEKAHILQLAYYLKVFADKSEQIKSGTIHYPRLRKTQNIYLTDELRCEVENLEKEIQAITGKKNVPNEFPKRNFCRCCSYYEFCFS